MAGCAVAIFLSSSLYPLPDTLTYSLASAAADLCRGRLCGQLLPSVSSFPLLPTCAGGGRDLTGTMISIELHYGMGKNFMEFDPESQTKYLQVSKLHVLRV